MLILQEGRATGSRLVRWNGLYRPRSQR